MNRRITLNDVLRIPYEEVVRHVSAFVKDLIEKAGVDKVVVGLSGGVDSSTVLALLAKALGSNRVIGIIMPDTRITNPRDVEDAISLAKSFGIKHYIVEINNIFDSYTALPFFDKNDRISNGNLRARIRMSILYYYANRYNALVAGTGDRSEILIGYYTKYGDGGADFLPIGSLYKTQVRRLASYLGLPKNIVEKPSSPGFWIGHLAEEELGLKYEVIDLVLYALFDKGLKPSEVPEYTGISRSIVDRVLEMHRRSRHKRIFPPVPIFPWMKIEPIREI
ncbi:MAG: NAD+ synthase [Thermoprotei archaeon]